jgi:uncharacterized protein (DUF952 family)
MPRMRIFHVATLADWQQAKASGSYTTSTYGATLAEVGYLHAARREQVAGVLAQFYQDVAEPILVLEIDTDLLDVPWRQDQVGDDTYPHIYGPLSPRAVVAFHPPSREAFERAVTGAARRPPTPPLTLAFQGVACLLVLACLIFFFAALLENSHNAGRPYPNAAPALLWTFTIVSGCCALLAFGFAEGVRPRHTEASVSHPGRARV